MYHLLLKPKAESDLRRLHRYGPSDFDMVYQAILALGGDPTQAKRVNGANFWSRQPSN